MLDYLLIALLWQSIDSTTKHCVGYIKFYILNVISKWLIICACSVAVVHNKNLYIFGGYNGLHDVHFNDLYMYQPGEWPTVNHAMARVSQVLFITLGRIWIMHIFHPLYCNILYYHPFKALDANEKDNPSSSLIEIFTHLKLCLADAIHNFKWVEIIQICYTRCYL